jgi:hypothetical protein
MLGVVVVLILSTLPEPPVWVAVQALPRTRAAAVMPGSTQVVSLERQTLVVVVGVWLGIQPAEGLVALEVRVSLFSLFRYRLQRPFRVA